MGDIKYLFLNPFSLIAGLLLIGSFLSWLYWYCKRTFVLKGSWKNLDKSMHWRDR